MMTSQASALLLQNKSSRKDFPCRLVTCNGKPHLVLQSKMFVWLLQRKAMVSQICWYHYTKTLTKPCVKHAKGFCPKICPLKNYISIPLITLQILILVFIVSISVTHQPTKPHGTAPHLFQ